MIRRAENDQSATAASEALVVFFVVAADGTAHHLLLAVAVVVPADGTAALPRTRGEFFLRVLADVVAVALPFVAALAEVGVAPTEPLADAATKLALELDEVLSVLGTVLDGNVAAVGTDQFLCLEGPARVLLVHGRHAVLASPEVRALALEAHEVRVYYHRVLHGLPEVRRLLLLQLRVTLLQLLELQPFGRHPLDLLVQHKIILRILVQLTLLGHRDPFLAEGTETEVEEDAGGQPTDLETLLQALHVENVSTTAPRAGRRRQGLHVAHCTILVPVDAVQRGIALSALLVEAGQTLLLVVGTVAGMATAEDLVAGTLGQVLAVLALADVGQGLGTIQARVFLSDRLVAIAALPR